jgi:hypothetical protein
MTLAITSLIDALVTTDLSTYVSASFAPTPGRWLVLDIGSDFATAPNIPTLTDSGPGLSYIQEATIVGGFGGGVHRRVTRFYAWTGTAPGSFTVTMDYASQVQTECEWVFYEIFGADLTDPFVQSVTNTLSNSTPTATLAPFISTANRPLATAGAGTTYDSVDGTQIGLPRGSGNTIISWWHPITADQTISAKLSVTAEWKMIASEIRDAGTITPTVSDPFGMAGSFGG